MHFEGGYQRFGTTSIFRVEEACATSFSETSVIVCNTTTHNVRKRNINKLEISPLYEPQNIINICPVSYRGSLKTVIKN
jgi:hypothetical protein